MRLLDVAESLMAPRASGVADGTSYKVYGEGKTIVLIHGVGMQQAIWAPQVSALSASHQVITYDMLGHGESRLPTEHVELADYARQLAGLLDHLDIGECTVIGHSMGALVALEFALRYPARVVRVVALNAAFNRTREQRAAVLARAEALEHIGVSATIDSTIERWFGNPVPAVLQGYAELVTDLMQNVDPVGYARSYRLFATSDAAHAGRLRELALPVLYMTGELDPNSTPEMSKSMSLETPGAQCVVLKGARHKMPITCAQEVNERILRFLDS